jgi:hypothetical protein
LPGNLDHRATKIKKNIPDFIPRALSGKPIVSSPHRATSRPEAGKPVRALRGQASEEDGTPVPA